MLQPQLECITQWDAMIKNKESLVKISNEIRNTVV